MQILDWVKRYRNDETSLYECPMYIGGQHTASQDGKVFPVTDPATGHRLFTVPSATTKDTCGAMDAAEASLKDWSRRPGIDRGSMLERLADVLLSNKDELAKLITLEEGKPLTQAVWEIKYSADYLRWYAGEAPRIAGYSPAGASVGRHHDVVYRPIGVVVGVTPWNLPCAMPVRKMAAALAAGCTLVIKPAEQTPGTALALADLTIEAGLPDGVFNVVTGDPPSVVTECLRHPATRMLTFTGSRDVGRILMGQASARSLRVCLQMGGNAPFIVFEDADLDVVTEAIVINKYRNSGQSCLSANRLFVHESVRGELLRRVVARVEKLKVGHGLTPGAEMGPVIDESAIVKIQSHVDDAVAQGARVLCGGSRLHTATHAPFGGLKESGIGREGGREGIMEFLEAKLISWRDS